MKTLIVDDDSTSRLLLQEFLKAYGPFHLAADGREAVAAVHRALASSEPYDLICLDIMMPGMDGHEALRTIRAEEEALGLLSPQGSKILMITALDDIKNVGNAYYNLCNGYLTKPLRKATLLEELRKLGLIG